MNLHVSRLFVLAAALISFSITSQAAEISAVDVWIDVRSPEEHREANISGHSNITHTQIADKIATLVSDKDTPVYLYCASGRRAGIAKEALEHMGYTNVTNAGGIDEVRKQLSTR